MRTFTPEEKAQADACDREKAQPSLIQQICATLEQSPDGRRLESDPLRIELDKIRKRGEP